MTDRELLELAAKAAGIVIDRSWPPKNNGAVPGFDVLGNACVDWHNGTKWNPLTDDGDALRLAVKLGVNVFCNRPAMVEKYGIGRVWSLEAEYDADPYAATRRAIVRAAAEIGKTL